MFTVLVTARCSTRTHAPVTFGLPFVPVTTLPHAVPDSFTLFPFTGSRFCGCRTFTAAFWFAVGLVMPHTTFGYRAVAHCLAAYGYPVTAHRAYLCCFHGYYTRGYCVYRLHYTVYCTFRHVPLHVLVTGYAVVTCRFLCRLRFAFTARWFWFLPHIVLVGSIPPAHFILLLPVWLRFCCRLLDCGSVLHYRTGLVIPVYHMTHTFVATPRYRCRLLPAGFPVMPVWLFPPRCRCDCSLHRYTVPLRFYGSLLRFTRSTFTVPHVLVTAFCGWLRLPSCVYGWLRVPRLPHTHTAVAYVQRTTALRLYRVLPRLLVRLFHVHPRTFPRLCHTRCGSGCGLVTHVSHIPHRLPHLPFGLDCSWLRAFAVYTTHAAGSQFYIAVRLVVRCYLWLRLRSVYTPHTTRLCRLRLPGYAVAAHATRCYTPAGPHWFSSCMDCRLLRSSSTPPSRVHVTSWITLVTVGLRCYCSSRCLRLHTGYGLHLRTTFCHTARVYPHYPTFCLLLPGYVLTTVPRSALVTVTRFTARIRFGCPVQPCLPLHIHVYRSLFTYLLVLRLRLHLHTFCRLFGLHLLVYAAPPRLPVCAVPGSAFYTFYCLCLPHTFVDAFTPVRVHVVAGHCRVPVYYVPGCRFVLPPLPHTLPVGCRYGYTRIARITPPHLPFCRLPHAFCRSDCCYLPCRTGLPSLHYGWILPRFAVRLPTTRLRYGYVAVTCGYVYRLRSAVAIRIPAVTRCG